MRIHVRTVCFSAWFLMGMRLMQSYCLCVCVYILLPSPITFGLIAQFQSTLVGGRGSRGAAGPASVIKISRGEWVYRCPLCLELLQQEFVRLQVWKCQNNRMVGSSLHKWPNLCKALLNSFPRSQETELMANQAVGNAETFSVLEQSWLPMSQSPLLVVGPHSTGLSSMSCPSLFDVESLTGEPLKPYCLLFFSSCKTRWIWEVLLTKNLLKHTEWWQRSMSVEIWCSKSEVTESLGWGAQLGSGTSELSRNFLCQGYERYNTADFCHRNAHKPGTVQTSGISTKKGLLQILATSLPSKRYFASAAMWTQLITREEIMAP